MGTEIIFYIPSPGADFFQCLLFGTDFSLVLMFPGLIIEAPLLFTVQGKCIYIFLKRRIRKLNFRSYVPSIDKHKF